MKTRCDRAGETFSTFTRFHLGPGTFAWVYDYRNPEPVERCGWISSGFEISVQLRGSWVQHGRWGGSVRAEPGSSFEVRPGEPYSNERRADRARGGRQVGFLLVPEQHPRFREYTDHLQVLGHAAPDARMTAAARELAHCVDSGLPIDRPSMHEAITSFARERFSESRHDPLVVARNYLVRNLAAPLYMRHVAEQARMHPAVFTRHFARRFGVTPVRYRLLLRINAAALRLWQSPELPNDAIAAEVGFEDPSFYFRSFRAVTGFAPGAYARRARLEPPRLRADAFDDEVRRGRPGTASAAAG